MGSLSAGQQRRDAHPPARHSAFPSAMQRHDGIAQLPRGTASYYATNNIADTGSRKKLASAGRAAKPLKPVRFRSSPLDESLVRRCPDDRDASRVVGREVHRLVGVGPGNERVQCLLAEEADRESESRVNLLSSERV